MNNQKLQNLLKDEKFIEVLGGAGTPEEVQKVFNDNGLEASVDEIKKLADDSVKILNASELDSISGGVSNGLKSFGKGLAHGVTAGVAFGNKGFTKGKLGRNIGNATGLVILSAALIAAGYVDRE